MQPASSILRIVLRSLMITCRHRNRAVKNVPLVYSVSAAFTLRNGSSVPPWMRGALHFACGRVHLRRLRNVSHRSQAEYQPSRFTDDDNLQTQFNIVITSLFDVNLNPLKKQLPETLVLYTDSAGADVLDTRSVSAMAGLGLSVGDRSDRTLIAVFSDFSCLCVHFSGLGHFGSRQKLRFKMRLRLFD